MFYERRGYVAAGLLFGYLRAELGFGDLAMISTDLGPSVLRYVWEFKAGGRRYQLERSVTFGSFKSRYELRAFARQISEEWKIQGKDKAAQ